MILMLVLLPFPAALLAYLMGRKNENTREYFAIGFTAAMLLLSILIAFTGGEASVPGILLTGLHFTADGFRRVYALITALMWAGTTLFSREYFAHEREGLNRYYLFMLMTLGATEGVMLSADLMTAFVFFEILSLTSFTWVIHEETPGAVRAGYTYLFIAVIGGLILFMGLLLIWTTCGTLTFSELPEAASRVMAEGRGDGVVPLSPEAAYRRIMAGGICILLGFGAKAGMFPLHIWLPKAHPVAPSPASALLSGILTKVGIYGILMTALSVFSGNAAFGLLVFVLGLITMFLGALLALFSVNLKRTLACSSMSQIGFILTGIGMASYLPSLGEEGAEGVVIALSGAMLHMTNHSLIKLVLFMAAGVVVMNLHTLTLNDIRGYGRHKRLLAAAFALGALGISGVPLFNGYISKTLLHEGIVHAQEVTHALGMSSVHAALVASEWVFLVSGGFTFAYMLKLFICLFIEKNEDPARQASFDENPRCMNALSSFAICAPALLMVILGQPGVVKPLAAFMMGMTGLGHFEAFALVNLKGGAISLAIGACLYLFVVRRLLMKEGRYLDLWPKALDLEDLVYRPLLLKVIPKYVGGLTAVFGENRILGPLASVTMFLAGFAGRVLSDSMDAVIVLLRRTLVRERKVADGKVPEHIGRIRAFRRETADTMAPIVMNFSFALMMTCIGILMILGVIMYYAARML